MSGLVHFKLNHSAVKFSETPLNKAQKYEVIAIFLFLSFAVQLL